MGYRNTFLSLVLGLSFVLGAHPALAVQACLQGEVSDNVGGCRPSNVAPSALVISKGARKATKARYQNTASGKRLPTICPSGLQYTSFGCSK